MKRILLLTFVFFFLFTFVAYAQSEPSPQDQLVSSVVATVAAIAALVSNSLINLIKTTPRLSDENKSRLAKAATEVIAVVVSLATGYITALLAQWLGLISDAGIQAVVVSMLTPVFSEARYRLAKLQPAK